MRADRLLSILLLLQVHRRMTARELATRLEVSERTIHRDMDALSTAGIPITSERGRGGGWRLLEPYRTNLTGLNEAEIQALFLHKPARLLADLGLREASEAALIKLLASLPSIRRQDAEFIRQRIHIDGSGWHQRDEAVPTLPILQDALWQERRLHLSYQRSGGDGSLSERLVDPLGLVAKGNVWYLIAAVENQPRTYRVSRIAAASLTEEPSRLPEGFDLATFWAESSAAFIANLPRYVVTIRVAPEILDRVRSPGRFVTLLREDAPDAAGWSRLELRFDVEWEACEFALSFGPRLEVIEPVALRQRVVRAAEGIVALYRISELHRDDAGACNAPLRATEPSTAQVNDFSPM